MESKKEKNEEVLSLGLATNRNPKRKRDEDCKGRLIELLKERQRIMEQRSKCVVQKVEGLHLIHLLLLSATLINENKIDSAVDNLIQLYKYASVNGNSGQRVASYFADALTARLVTSKSRFYSQLINKPSPAVKFSAFTHLYKVSPFYQFAHFTANQMILEAFEREEENNNSALHVFDFDISYGFQWPSLIQSFSEKASRLNRFLLLSVTGYGRSSEELVETEARLMSFSKSFQNIGFEFHGFLRGSKMINMSSRENETIAVNLVFYLSSLTNVLQISDMLNFVHSLNPSVVVLVEKEGSIKNRSSCVFLSCYMDSLQYYAAMFDSLDDLLPTESPERLNIEKNHLGQEIREVITCDESNCLRFEMLESWIARMESSGLLGMKLSSKTTIQAKLLLKMGCHHHSNLEDECGGGGFRVYERDGGTAISLGWQDRLLVTVSAWRIV